VNLRAQITSDLAKELKDQIDFEIVSNLLKEEGWHRFDLTVSSNKEAVDIAYWVEENCKYKYIRNGTRYIFENEYDASRFVMKWMFDGEN
jgi:hypothetical protein